MTYTDEEIKEMEKRKIEMLTGAYNRQKAAQLQDEKDRQAGTGYYAPKTPEPEPSEAMRAWLKMSAYQKAHTPKPDR